MVVKDAAVGILLAFLGGSGHTLIARTCALVWADLIKPVFPVREQVFHLAQQSSRLFLHISNRYIDPVRSVISAQTVKEANRHKR